MMRQQRGILKKISRHPAAFGGLLVIVIAVLVAIFAYLLAPDPSPFANRIILEIGGRKPGYTQQYFKLEKDREISTGNFFSRMLNGREDKYEYIPITGYRLQEDSVIIQKFMDEGVEEPQSFLLKKSPAQFEQENIESKTYWLGTDKFGRDILSRLLVGTRVSLGVGLITVFLALTIGVLLGSLAGYYRGRADAWIMWFINVIWSIPTLLLVFAITLVLGKGFWQVFIAVGLTMWVGVARLVRGQVLGIRELEYVEAARALGFSNARIIFRHILPNLAGPLLVMAASIFASAILIEAGLSFLGVGVQPPQPSWGLMIKENYNFIITQNPVLALAPGVAIMLLVFAFNLLGNGLRDVLDVRE